MLWRAWLLTWLVTWTPVASYGQVVTLPDALHAAQENNRTIRIAELDRQKAQAERDVV